MDRAIMEVLLHHYSKSGWYPGAASPETRGAYASLIEGGLLSRAWQAAPYITEAGKALVRRALEAVRVDKARGPAVKRVTVRWMDGTLEEFDCERVRFSPHFIWISFGDGDNRWIPAGNVRAFQLKPDSKI